MMRPFEDTATTPSRRPQSGWNRITRPTVARYQPPYHFEPPEMLARFIADAPASLAIVLFWTPRYVNILPIDGTPAAEAERSLQAPGGCTRILSRRHRRLVGAATGNLDPANFYETNHYRDSLAIKIEREIASPHSSKSRD